MKTEKTENNAGAVAVNGISVVTYDEEEPLHATAVPLEAEAMVSHERPGMINHDDSGAGGDATRRTNNNAPMATGHGCDLSLCGNTRLRQMSPGTHFSLSLCGNHYMDLLDSEYPTGTTITLMAIRLCGNMNITVAPGTQVVVRRLQLCGNRDVYVEENPEQEQPAPRLTLYVLSLFGNIRVRSNRTDMGRFFRRS